MSLRQIISIAVIIPALAIPIVLGQQQQQQPADDVIRQNLSRRVSSWLISRDNLSADCGRSSSCSRLTANR